MPQKKERKPLFTELSKKDLYKRIGKLSETLPYKLMSQTPVNPTLDDAARLLSQRLDKHIREFRIKPNNEGLMVFNMPRKALEKLTGGKLTNRQFRRNLAKYDYHLHLHRGIVSVKKMLK